MVRAKSINLLEENIEVKLFDIGLGDNCFDLTLKAKASRTKISKWLYFQTLSPSGLLLVCMDLWPLLLSPTNLGRTSPLLPPTQSPFL